MCTTLIVSFMLNVQYCFTDFIGFTVSFFFLSDEWPFFKNVFLCMSDCNDAAKYIKILCATVPEGDNKVYFILF